MRNEHQQHQEAREFLRLPLCTCDECMARRENLYDMLMEAEALKKSAEVRQWLRDNMKNEDIEFTGFFE